MVHDWWNKLPCVQGSSCANLSTAKTLGAWGKQGELKAKGKKIPRKDGKKVRGKLWETLGMCLFNVTCSVEFPCSVIQVGSMLSSQRLNKVMAEVSPVVCKGGGVGSCKKWFQRWGGGQPK